MFLKRRTLVGTGNSWLLVMPTFFLVSCVADSFGGLTEDEWVVVKGLSPLPAPPIDSTNAVSGDSIAETFGEALFLDPNMSPTGDVACVTCHDPELGFSDGIALSEGVGVAARNAPGLIDTAHSQWYFWDGGCDTLWCQAMGPIENAVEMGSSRLYVAHLIENSVEYSAQYQQLFGELPDLSDISRFPLDARPIPTDPDQPQNQQWEEMTAEDQMLANVVFANVSKSLAAFERTIVSSESSFDSFVRGVREGDELLQVTYPAAALRGLQLFVGDAGCVECHSGPYFSNGEFYNNGVGGREWMTEPDLGRYEGVEDVLDNEFNAAGAYSDDPRGEQAQRLIDLESSDDNLGQYRVPTLRNVALTAPYMHGGQHESLEEVVGYYSSLDETPVEGVIDEKLRPANLSESDILDIVAFLQSLSG
jgi:cytochrome c peroxidase